jgi:DNA polymerase
VDEPTELSVIAGRASRCTACDLYVRATQVVFGTGRTGGLMFVGEQPGDHEDREGLPFVGPAGRLLDRAMDDAGLDRSEVYLTNAVKHFKWEPRGKRRIHQRPNRSEVVACRPWVEEELAVVQPSVLVLLGAVATEALLGRRAKVTLDRGRALAPTDPIVQASDEVRELLPSATVITIHPSAVLRARDRDAQLALLVDDLVVARKALG